MKLVTLAGMFFGLNMVSAQSDFFDPVDLTESCHVENIEYWSLISWYIGRSMVLTVAVISESENLEVRSNFATTFIRNLMNQTSLPVAVTNYDMNYESDAIGESDRYDWQGELVKPRVTQRFKRQSQLFSNSRNTLRKDEPQRGIMVIVKNITVLDNYLVGTGRSPFRTPRSNYVIVLRNIMESWKEHSDRVLRKLWRVYGIVNVILLAPCSDSGEDVVASYFPFEVNASIADPEASDYGAIRWIPMDELDYSPTLLRKLGHMNGYPFRVSIFQRYPTALKPPELSPIMQQAYYSRATKFSGGFGGFDGMVLGNMAEKMGFRTVVVSPRGNDFGYIGNNGSYFGSMGDVLYRRAYMSMNGRFIADYGTDEIDYLFPVNFDKFCIISPKASKIPEWMAIFKCFQIDVWLLIVGINSICGAVWWLLRFWSKSLRLKIQQNNQPGETSVASRFSFVALEMWLIIWSFPSIYMPKSGLERIFMAGCLMGSVIIVGSFQGSLTTSFSTTAYYKDINTLRELDASGLPLGTTSNSLIDIFGDGGTPLLNSLISKFHLLRSGPPTIDRTAYDRDICCIERCADIEVIIATRYELPDGTSLLHAIPESPKYCQIAYIVKKGWPWMAVFNDIIHRFNEAGLLQKWYKVTQDSITAHERIVRRNYVEKLRVLAITDVQTAFYILFIGLLFCLLVLICEIVLSKRLKKNGLKICN